ncbi:hypothetical protein ACFQYP_22465 [Nonomuraea antimicrobica]
MIPRRRFLLAAAATTAAATLTAQPAQARARTHQRPHQTAPPQPEGTVTGLGPASVASPLGNGEFVGGVLYAGSRGLSPNVVGAYDLAQDSVTAHFDIPTGVGIWAMCRTGTDVYIGTHARSDLFRLDTTTNQVTKVAEYPDRYIWTMASSPTTARSTWAPRSRAASGSTTPPPARAATWASPPPARRTSAASRPTRPTSTRASAPTPT